MRWATPLLAVLVLAGCAALRPGGGPQRLGAEAAGRLREASVLLFKDGRPHCTGAIAGRADLVVTAAHCLAGREGQIWKLRLADGTETVGRVMDLDAGSDVAVLAMPVRANLSPLPIADSDVADKGTPLLFLGRPLAGRKIQSARVRRRGQCPDLQAVPDALFASIDGDPGDSGAPIVSEEGIVGLIHGGTRCHIAIPSAHLGPALWRAMARLGTPLPEPPIPHVHPTPAPSEDPAVHAAMDALALGDLDRARRLVREPASTNPPDASALRLAAAIALAQGRRAEARWWLEHYLRAFPDAPDADLAWTVLLGLRP